MSRALRRDLPCGPEDDASVGSRRWDSLRRRWRARSFLMLSASSSGSAVTFRGGGGAFGAESRVGGLDDFFLDIS